MADDDYAPAITETTTDEPGAESTLVTREASESTAPVLTGGETGDNPNQPPGREPRGQRQVSDKTKAMLRGIASRAAKEEGGLSGVSDDLVPMETVSPPAAAVAAVAVPPPVETPAAPPSSPAVVAAAAPIPVPSPAVDLAAKAAAEQAKLLADLKEKQFADREAALADREAKLPRNSDLIERPGATLAAYLRDVYGVTDDAEFKDVITDIVTELSETTLGVKLPSEVKQLLESRKAVRSVKAYKADLTRQQQAIADQRAAAEKQAREEREAFEAQQRERQAVAQVSQLLSAPGVRDAHKFLHDAELTGGGDPAAIVIEVVKEQIKAGQPADWQTAARYADNYFKAQAEAAAKKAAHLQSLLAPAAPAAPAKAATPPGGTPGPVPKAPTVAVAATTPDLPSESSDEPTMDRRDRRAVSVRRLVAKHFKGGATT